MGDVYQVRPGDTALAIAGRLTGAPARWTELRGVNPTRDWNLLRAGELLALPTSWGVRRPPRASVGDVSNGMTLADARARTPWLSAGFFVKLVAIARKYGLDPVWLLLVMYQESGVHPVANPNKSSRANGLIHWMPSSTIGGTTAAQRDAMTAEQQLDLVDLWLAGPVRQMAGSPFVSAGMVYAIVLAPARLKPGANEDTPIYWKTVECSDVAAPGHTTPSNKYDTYCANRSLDHGGKGQILMRDLTQTIESRGREASFEKFRVRLAQEGGASGSSSPAPQNSGGAGVSSKSTPTNPVKLALIGAVVTVAATFATALVRNTRRQTHG